jgi:hypothetical protein
MIHRFMTLLRFSAQCMLRDLEKKSGETPLSNLACHIGPAAAAWMDFFGRAHCKRNPNNESGSFTRLAKNALIEPPAPCKARIRAGSESRYGVT